MKNTRPSQHCPPYGTHHDCYDEYVQRNINGKVVKVWATRCIVLNKQHSKVLRKVK